MHAHRRASRQSTATTAPRQPAAAWARAGREVALLGTGLGVYQASRLLGGRDADAAFTNAQSLQDVQRHFGLPSEQSVQALLLSSEPLVRAANGYYAAAHLPVTALALIWLLLTRPVAYRRARQALLAATGAALAVYLLVPVAPPRMLPGFVDTAAVFGQSVYGDAGASALANQYAALPSLHVGWAVLMAVACVSAARSRWRWLWVLHPTVTAVVVVGTANHYWVDVVAGVALVVAAWLLTGRRQREDPRAAAGAARQVRRRDAAPVPADDVLVGRS